MKIAMHNWMRPESFETSVSRMAKLGYDAIEVAAFQGLDFDELKSIIKKYNISCSGAVTLMMDGLSIIDPDATIRKNSIEYVKYVINLVSHLGGTFISLVPSTVGRVKPMSIKDDEWKWGIESLDLCYRYAKSKAITIAIEPINRFETFFINRVDQALALANEVSEEIGVCADLFHMSIEETNLIDALAKTKGRLINVHAADNNRMPVGMGSTDWNAVIKTLKDIGYQGLFSSEFCAPLDRTTANPYPNNVISVKDLAGVSPEDIKFLEDHGTSSVYSEEFYTMLMKKNMENIRKIF